MARLGKVVSNTMTSVNPSNLKLIGRATYLIESHVNDILNQSHWIKNYGITEPVTYGESNAILFDAITYVKGNPKAGQISEVGLSIIRILETLKKSKSITWQASQDILEKQGLEKYLLDLNPKNEKLMSMVNLFLVQSQDPRVRWVLQTIRKEPAAKTDQ